MAIFSITYAELRAELIREAVKQENVPEGLFTTLDALTEDQRYALFHAYCVHCGDTNPFCKCIMDC